MLVALVAAASLAWERPLPASATGVADLRRALGPAIPQDYRPGKVYASRQPTDPLFPAQSHLTTIQAPTAWDTSQGSTSVRIAILDTGVAPHPDLPTVSPGDRTQFLTHTGEYDTEPCPTGRPAASESAHGTHVAGIAAAQGGQGSAERGGTGVVWRATLLDVRVLGPCGDGFTDDIARGIVWAADRGAQVINLSLGGEEDDAVLLAAIRYARSRGAVVIAAAGNAACGSPESRLPQYPAAYPEVLSVASTDVNTGDPTSCFSRRGPWLDLAAPGGQILSTKPAGLPSRDYAVGVPFEADGSGYGLLSGSSMSAAVVTGAAALLFAAVPGITSAQVEARLIRSADPTARTCADYNGGRLNLASAVADQVSTTGYRVVTAAGQVAAFGGECHLGDPVGQGVTLAQPLVGLANTVSKAGYWLVSRSGQVLGYGDALPYGSTSGIALNRPIVGMAVTPTGRGYWLVASDGGIFAFGDAAFFGSTGGVSLNQPIVGMAATPSGRGYWTVAADGGIFAFGDAAFRGSTGGITLNRPVLSLQPTLTGRGYWTVAGDGGVFAFGDARFLGSTGDLVLNRPIVGLAATPRQGGYWIVGADGGIFAFGDAPFLGSGSGQLAGVVAGAG